MEHSLRDKLRRTPISRERFRTLGNIPRSAQRRWILASALLVLTSGCTSSSQGPDRSPLPGPPSFESPQAVLRSVRAAIAGHNYKTLCRCLTPESLEMQAGVLVYMSASFALAEKMPTALPAAGALLGDGEAIEDVKLLQRMKAARPKITAVLKKHGLGDATDPSRWPRIDSPADMSALAEPVPDKAAFVAEMLETLAACKLTGREDWMFGGGPMTDLTISGNSATGEIRDPESGDEHAMPIRFKKIDDRWLIDL